MKISKDTGTSIFYIFVGCIFVTGALLEIFDVNPIIKTIATYSYETMLKNIGILKWISLVTGIIVIFIGTGLIYLENFYEKRKKIKKRKS